MSLREIGQFTKTDTWSSETENDQLTVRSRLPPRIGIGNTLAMERPWDQSTLMPAARIGLRAAC